MVQLRELNIDEQCYSKKLEQYGRRLCLRSDFQPTVKDEPNDDVLEFNLYLKSLLKEAIVIVLDNLFPLIELDSVIRTEKTIKKCKSILVRFTTFSLLNSKEKKTKSGFKMKLDFTKSRLNMLKKNNDHVKEIPAINFCYADVNCRFQVKFHDAKQENIFYSNYGELHDIIDCEN